MLTHKHHILAWHANALQRSSFGEVKKAVQEEQDKDHLESTGYGVLLVLGKVSNAGLRRLVMRHAKNLAADLEER